MSIIQNGKPIALCSDHAGYELKSQIIAWLNDRGIATEDFGTDSTESCDYPDYAHPAALAVEAGAAYPAIAMCGTGNGIAITLNKHQGIRAALCWNTDLARLAREHNDANVLVLPARFITPDQALAIIETFLNTPFEGGRHIRRIQKIPLH